MVVQLEPLLELSRRMTALQESLLEESSELARVFQHLQELSGMEEAADCLQRLRRNLEEQSWQAYQSAQALSEAARCYSRCERRICDELEEAVVRGSRLEGGAVDLSGIRAMLNE